MAGAGSTLEDRQSTHATCGEVHHLTLGTGPCILWTSETTTGMACGEAVPPRIWVQTTHTGSGSGSVIRDGVDVTGLHGGGRKEMKLVLRRPIPESVGESGVRMIFGYATQLARARA